jgi:hypothetical protein
MFPPLPGVFQPPPILLSPEDRLPRPLVERHGQDHAGGIDLSGSEQKARADRKYAAKNGQMIKMGIAEFGMRDEKEKGKIGQQGLLEKD